MLRARAGSWAPMPKSRQRLRIHGWGVPQRPKIALWTKARLPSDHQLRLPSRDAALRVVAARWLGGAQAMASQCPWPLRKTPVRKQHAKTAEPFHSCAGDLDDYGSEGLLAGWEASTVRAGILHGMRQGSRVQVDDVAGTQGDEETTSRSTQGKRLCTLVLNQAGETSGNNQLYL